MNIIGIDPGNEKSAYVLYANHEIREYGIYINEDMRSIVSTTYADLLAIEQCACYGMPVGATVFDTSLWAGRFIERYVVSQHKPYRIIYRKDVKMLLCNSMRAKDGNIRQAIIDRYEPTGGGKIPQIGTKAKPGPLYGISKDVWSALAIAITAHETINQK